MLVADGLKHKKGNLISSPNPRINTQYPGFWIAWNVDRTHLVHRDSISSPSSFPSFFLSFYFFYLFVLKRFETTRARYFQNETFQRRRNVRRTCRCTLYVLCEWVCTCNYYFNRETPGLPVRHFNFFHFFFFFFHFVSFGLLSFSIVICDRISTCIIQYSYINRATQTGLRLERPSTLFSIFLLFTSASEFALHFLSRGSCRNRVAFVHVYIVSLYLCHECI